MQRSVMPRLFGHALRRCRVIGDVVVQWRKRIGGLEVVVTHDPRLRSAGRWYWQIDAWDKKGVVTGGARTERAAIVKLERVLSRLEHELGKARLNAS